MKICCNVEICFECITSPLKQFVLKPLFEPRKHCSPTSQNYVIVELDLKVGITLLNCIKGQFINPNSTQSSNLRVEQELCSVEPSSMIYRDDSLPIWQLIGSLLLGEWI